MDVGFKQVSREGTASFVLPMGKLYDVRIFYDLNRNQKLDANEPNGLAQNITPTPLTAAENEPVTLAFGVVGPVAGRPRSPATDPVKAHPKPQSIPREAEPYLQNVPPWLQEKLLR